MANHGSSETPSQCMPNFDQVVTQWIGPSYVLCGRAWISSHVHVVGELTRPATVKVHAAMSIFGVTSAVNTGHADPVSYWPGGSRTSAELRRPVNPRVKRLMVRCSRDLLGRPLLQTSVIMLTSIASGVIIRPWRASRRQENVEQLTTTPRSRVG